MPVRRCLYHTEVKWHKFILHYNVDNSVNAERVHLEEIYNDNAIDGYNYHKSFGLLILLHRTISTIYIQCWDQDFENRVLGYFSPIRVQTELIQ